MPLNLLVIAGCMFSLWLLSLRLKDASIVDIFWGLGFVVVAWVSLFSAGELLDRHWLLALLVTLWGCRLAGYLAWRNVGKGEDSRYTEMREKPGRNFALFSLVVVFGLQGLIMWVVSWPLQAAMLGTQPWNWLDLLGITLWIVGLGFESIGDWQLARFKADPANKGKVMDRGLWRYTRHPNYFGDFLVWWGYYLLSLAAGGPWWTIAGPLLMAYCLIYFSGAMHLERTITDRRPGYADYIRRTSAFIPWPPRSSRDQANASSTNSHPAGNR